MSPHLFCFGLGYSARALARRLAPRGFRVSGTTRSGTAEEDAATAAPEPYHVHRFDREHPLAPEVLADVTHVLVSIPPDAGGDPVTAAHGVTLAGLHPAWVGYLSTTGVYGDTGGAWVDETTPLAPTVARSADRARAEAAWLSLWREHGLPVHVFRLAGIYGPGRSAIDSVRAGRAHRVIKPGQVFSRIHVEDIALVLEASLDRPNPGAIYNVCDDEPAPPQDVIAHAAALLGADPPPELSWDEARRLLSPMALSFYADSRRVRNDRIRRELQVTLRYPTYREGLRSCL